MAELARGNVTDRPWGRTLGALALRGLTGQVNVLSDGRTYSIVFDGGVIVGASSPLANDAAVRVAMTGGLVSSTQVNDLSRRLAAARGLDEIDVIAEAVRLQPDQATRLRRRVVAQRAARTFSVENGTFVVEDRVTLAIVPGSELDIRSVVYLGARNNLGDQRLESELDQMGTFFTLKPDADDDLVYFGFSEAERAVVQRLRSGATLVDLHQAAPEIDGRTQRAIIYSLISCNACDVTIAPPQGIDLDAPTYIKPSVARTASQNAIPQQVTRTPSGPAASASGPVVSRTSSANAIPQPVTRAPSTPMPRAPTAQPAPRAPTAQPTRAKEPTPSPDGTAAGLRMRNPTGGPPMPSLATGQPARTASKPATARAKRNTAETRETEELIRRKLVDARGDHFQVLGVARTATADEIRLAYFTLARKLHPDRLSALGITDDNREAQQLFAQINTAFATLNDPGKRDEYSRVLARGGEAAVRAEDSQAEELALRVMRAEEAFHRGEMALRRD
ncbi:MAG: DnaJ domain-containing protein, partial [Deltaproteobacteria bacterium]|nr:DnaJ domain-containing protein [Deltaproteobacteria bacterium]